MAQSIRKKRRGYGIGKGITMRLCLTKAAETFYQGSKMAGWALVVLFSCCFGPLSAQLDSDQALYWRISKGDHAAGYLLGTIHSEDPRVLGFSEEFIRQMTSCQVFAMELVPDLETLRRLGEYMHYQDANKLRHSLGEVRFEQVMQALSSYKVPLQWKTKMKVWAAMMTLSVPAPQGGLFMDMSISLRAEGAGLEVVGLETMEQQLSFLEDMPMAYQLDLLDRALEDYLQVDVTHRQMVDLYLKGELSPLWRLLEDQFEPLDPGIRDYFVGRGINHRNRRIISKLLPSLNQSSVFVAVGALHLYGQQGMLALLREQGFTLSPMTLPFAD
jgi:uncharacterized protein YbaP (TraB family)